MKINNTNQLTNFQKMLGFQNNKFNSYKFSQTSVKKTLTKIQTVNNLVDKKLSTVLPVCSPYLPKILNKLLIELDNLWNLYKNSNIVIESSKLFKRNNKLDDFEKVRYNFLCYLIKTIWQNVNETIELVEEMDPENDFSADFSNSDSFNLRLKDFYKHCFSLSYILYEIKAFMQTGHLLNVQAISILEAREFWTKNWEHELQVDFSEFVQYFQNRFGTLAKSEICWLKQDFYTFSNTDQVTIYAFDIFVQLYAPWKKLKEVWSHLRTSPACRPYTTYDCTKRRLENLRNNSYVFRMSSSHFGQWVVATKDSKGEIHQDLSQNRCLAEILIEGKKGNIYKYPNGANELLSKQELEVLVDCEIITISPGMDEYSATWDEDDSEESFLLCKICFSRSKNTKLEPCKHYVCNVCLNSYFNSLDRNKRLCPFCRQEVKSFSKVRFVRLNNENGENDQ